MAEDGNLVEQTPLRASRQLLDYYKQQKELLGRGTRNKLIAGALAYMKSELEAMPDDEREQVMQILMDYDPDDE